MKLSMLLDQARTGELDAISKKDKTDRKVVSYINLALIALYGRFPLATQEAIITLRPDIMKTVYTMDSSDSDVEIADGIPVPDDDFMTIISAYDEGGNKININDEGNDYSIYTVSYNQLQVPLLADNDYISIMYRRNPTLVQYVDDGNRNAVDVEVELPLQLIEPALHYVGYRAHGAVNGNVNAENNTHYTRYLMACEKVEALGLLTADDITEMAVTRKGFI